MGPNRTAMLLMLAASPAWAQPAPPASGVPPEPVKRIFTPPPVQWDHEMLRVRPALPQTAADFASLTGGMAFGMSPSEVNAHLSEPYPGLSWNGLRLANDYPGEARFFSAPIDRVGPLRMGLTACTGAASNIVFLFSGKGLFRLSYRLTAGKDCAGTDEAAQQIFARYVPIGQQVAMSVRYRTGQTQVVDITDPNAVNLAPIRWHQGTK